MENKELVGEHVARNINRRTYEAAEAGIAIDGENAAAFLNQVAGPLPPDSPLFGKFEKALKRAGLDGETFDLVPGVVARPRYRRLVTRQGILVRYPSELGDDFVYVDAETQEIRIRDVIVTDDVETERDSRRIGRI